METTYRPEGRRLHWKLAMVPVGALAVVLMMGTGVYAYESPDVAEGHPLYPIKRGIEQVHHRVFVPKTPEAEAKFQGWVTDRRIEEVEVKAKHVPLELKQQITEIHDAIELEEVTEEEKRRLFRAEVEALLDKEGESRREFEKPEGERPMRGLPIKARLDTEVEVITE